jgi:hypothetical protein
MIAVYLSQGGEGSRSRRSDCHSAFEAIVISPLWRSNRYVIARANRNVFSPTIHKAVPAITNNQLGP